MSTEYKPKGYSSLSPYLIVEDAARLAGLLQTIFHAQGTRKFLREDGKIMHLELLIDDSVLMLADATASYPPQRSTLHVYVPDSDQVYAKAIAAGCRAIEAPKQQDGDPDKRGTFEDFAGNLWSVSTQL
jgi:PhnB protein